MNKTALKNFATWSRRKLIEQVQTKVLLYGIDEKNGLHIEEQFGQLLINGQTYPLSMKTAFTALKKQLEQKGYKQLLEEVAYTWFNRIIAIRYMEVHEYLPERVNVLSSSVGRVDPDILFEYDTVDLTIKQEEVRELINAGNTEAAYCILFVAQCNALNRILPFMFEPIQDYTELLLPDFLLDAESVIKILVQNEELTESFAEIEVIGWLYQYYIAEEKDRVFAQKSKYKKEEIPFATQLFTPKWIVQYMVQNSLGRYWTEAHREDEDLIDIWEYFIKHDEGDFHEKIAPYVNKELKVEDIKLLDPAMGSGHMLVYAFEVFHEIYEKCGYPERDIPRLILENNLYGLDIDDRAYQLAAFAVVMKAAQYSRRFLRSVEREGIQLNLASIQETNHISDDVIAYIAQQEVGEQYNYVKAFFDQYHNAKTYGSLINITERDISFIEERLEHIQNHPVDDLFYTQQHDVAKRTLPALVKQTKIMRNEYDIVVMNPPYMGSGNMSKELGDFLKKKYSNSKSDLFAAFMEVDYYLKDNGFYAVINQHSWMFLKSFESLRNKLLKQYTIMNMLHLGSKAFEDIGGEIVQNTAFIARKKYIEDFLGKYVKLDEFNNPLLKEEQFFNIENLHYAKQSDFLVIPGKTIAYWLNDNFKSIFTNNNPLSSIAETKVGLFTCNNDYFLKYWFEVSKEKIGFNLESNEDSLKSKKKWFPYQKGGTNKKWYGNYEYVVNYENDGKEVKEYRKKQGQSYSLPGYEFYFREGITWTALTSSSNSFRYSPFGSIFDSNKGPMLISNDQNLIWYLLSFLNSIVAQKLLKFLNPTLSLQNSDVGKLPIIINEQSINLIETITKDNIQISKEDWDSFEISWDFKKHPFLKLSHTISIKNAYIEWRNFTDYQFNKLKGNEEEINRIFLDIYGVKDEIVPSIEDRDVTFSKAESSKDVRSLLSYIIGCMFGRYSLDIEGLAYAGGEWDDSKYDSFKPNPNGIVHFTESTYFENDIITRLREFLSVAFASETVDENMQWLAEMLVMKPAENPEARLRRYFMDEFFDDHCKTYKKRPIYWLVDSGKQKGLRTLIYMHRYQSDTMATIRFEHLQEIQAKYQQEITDMENRLINPNLSATDKKKLNAKKVSFEKKIEELREFDKRLAAIAAEEIEIDLDDGVKVNYEKFYRGGKGVLAKIK